MQLNTIGQNSFTKGMNLTLNDSLMRDDLVTYARNATVFSQEGDFLFYQTEQGNRFVVEVTYPCIGSCKLPDGTYCLFLTDNTNSEIGVFDTVRETYITKLNANFLNFNNRSLITASSKENNDCSYSVYWSDGRRNPDRILNLSQASTASFDSIRLAKLISLPTLTIQRSVNGLLPNGTYQVGLFYSVNAQRFGNFHSLSTPISVFSDNDNTGAVEITIQDIDSDFDEYQLVLIQNSKSTTTAKVVGTFPRTVNSVHVGNFNEPEYLTIPLESLVIENEIWVASDQINSNNQYLFRVGTESVPEPNYQQLALSIEAEYVVYQARREYYKDRNNIGYYRDENYLPYIQLLHKTSKWSSAFVLKGRDILPTDLGFAYGKDVYETNIKSCDPTEPLLNWQVFNTAGRMMPVQHTITDTCDGWEVGKGDFGYSESTDLYPDNPIQFGPYAGKPVQLFKFPDEEKVPRYEVIQGKTYINILGFRLKDVPRPLKTDGTVDTDWVGYRILRADREGNRSVISRGMFTNTRYYTELDKEVLFSNYPVNDISPDVFLSNTQTFYRNQTEINNSPMSGYKLDRLNFYSPHNTIGRYGLGTELKLETEEVAEVKGEFVEPYQHPKQRLLSQHGFWIAIAGGLIEAIFIQTGLANTQTEREVSIGLTGGITNKSTTRINKALDFFNVSGVIASVKAALAGDVAKITQIALALATLILFGPGILLTLFSLEALNFASEILTNLYNLVDYRQFALQHNSHARFVKSIPLGVGNKRRFITNYKYLEDGIQSFDNQLVNNFNKEQSVLLSINEPIKELRTEDTSRVTFSENKYQKLSSRIGSAYYGTIKRNVPNQYGRVETTTRFIKTHNNNLMFGENPIIFGGDCFITPYTFLKKQPFFTQTLANANYPDGVGYDYRLYRNIGYPRFWIDSFKYDFYELLGKKVLSRSSFIRTTTSKHNLDGIAPESTGIKVDSGYMYTSCNSAIEMMVESDYNLFFRESQEGEFFYSETQRTLSEIFRSDRLYKKEFFKYDLSFSKKADQVYAKQQDTNYDPVVYETCYNYSKNRLIYSLPAYKEQRFDNWQYFLTGNSREFSLSEFGNLTSLHRVDGERIIFLFDRSSPYITVGRQELQVTDMTITIGDGGLFAQQPRETLYTENAYANSQSRFAATSTQYGTHFISERQGRLFNFSGKFDEETRNGVYSWAKEFFPIKLLTAYPDYPYKDNPVSGVGFFLFFDPIAEMLFITKKDYLPKPEFVSDIVFSNNQFYYRDAVIELTNDYFFENVSFTLSYYPSEKSFIAFHDFVPDWGITDENGLFTFKGTSIWKHSDNCQQYCNYYGIQYPFEIEFVKSNKFQVQTLSSLEYYLECSKYNTDCINQHHELNENFDRLFIYNTEQCSGNLTIVPRPSSHVLEMQYPKYNGSTIDIFASKVENKYRINQFKDMVKDRSNPVHIMHTYRDGWRRVPNPVAINYKKDPRQQKLFRHYDTRILFGKSVPLTRMMIKLNLTKGIISPR